MESTLALVLVKSDLEQRAKFWGMLLAVGMFILVVAVVTVLVWAKAENLTFDRDAHLMDPTRVPYGSDANELRAAELDSLPSKAAAKDEGI